MNLTKFLEELRKTRNGWTGDGCIRKRSWGDVCPITAVCSRVKRVHFQVYNYSNAGQRLGLDPELVGRIVDAADYDTQTNGWLRSRLLKAVGL